MGMERVTSVLQGKARAWHAGPCCGAWMWRVNSGALCCLQYANVKCSHCALCLHAMLVSEELMCLVSALLSQRI